MGQTWRNASGKSSRKPPIAIVSDTISRYLGEDERKAGGAERQQYLIADRLAKRGYDVTVVTTKSAISSSERFRLRQVIPDVRGTAAAPYKVAQIVRGLHQTEADIYYVRGNDLLTIVTQWYAAASGNKFCFGIANDANINVGGRSKFDLVPRLYHRAIKSADCVVAQSERQQKLLAEQLNRRGELIPNGYPSVSEEEVLSATDRDFFLWVGSMDQDQKRPSRFLELATNIPNAQFAMIGYPADGEEDHYAHIRQRAEQIPNLEFVGFVPPDEIHEYYRRAIGLINTSEYEGFPNTFLEAWRYETPVVSQLFDVNGLLSEGEVGILAGEMGELERAVRQLQEDGDYRRTLGKNGRRYFEEHFSIARIVDLYEDVFTSLISSDAAL